jgi:hypothetical protein
MYLACSRGSVLPDKRQINQAIGFASKAWGAIVPALDDV